MADKLEEKEPQDELEQEEDDETEEPSKNVEAGGAKKKKKKKKKKGQSDESEQMNGESSKALASSASNARGVNQLQKAFQKMIIEGNQSESEMDRKFEFWDTQPVPKLGIFIIISLRFIIFIIK